MCLSMVCVVRLTKKLAEYLALSYKNIFLARFFNLHPTNKLARKLDLANVARKGRICKKYIQACKYRSKTQPRSLSLDLLTNF